MGVWKDPIGLQQNLCPTQMTPIVGWVCVVKCNDVVVVSISNICKIVIKHLVNSSLHLLKEDTWSHVNKTQQ